MFYHVVLYAALLIFSIGLLYKTSAWFRLDIGIHTKDVPSTARFITALKGILSVVFSPRLFTLAKVFFLDVLLQFRILKEDSQRWFMHMFIFWGFMLLLLMHALDRFVSEVLFSGYYATVNPFMFLRDFFGILVVVGICMAIYRRLVLKVPRLKTSSVDYYAIIILALVMFSGFLLEGTKITSYTRYQEMVEEYGDIEEEEELEALASYWVNAYGLVSPDLKPPFDEDVLEKGMELNEGCVSCHSRPQWAFGGYAVAWTIRPFADVLDNAGIPNLLWLIHILACFAGLAYLPFSKMFHVLATPLSLMANALMDKGSSSPVNIVTRQVMELDACTRCNTCSLHCSVAVASDSIGNENILPSERISFLKTYIGTQALDEKGLKAIQEGIYLCTNCDRCSVVCPAGINLRDLWFSVREMFIRKKRPVTLMLTPFSYYRGLNKTEIDPAQYDQPLEKARNAVTEKYERIKKTDQVIPLTGADTRQREKFDPATIAGSYSYCFACENCSTVCPVVGTHDDPQKALDLLPHQIMRSMGMGLKDLALGSNMLWDCLTCYQCQEHCPQNVKVTDVLFELKNIAAKETGGPAAEEVS